MRLYGKENSNQASIEKNYFLSIATLYFFFKLHFTSIMDTKTITRISNLVKRREKTLNVENKENQVDCLELPPLPHWYFVCVEFLLS